MRPSIRPGTSWTEARSAVGRPRAGVPALALAPAGSGRGQMGWLYSTYMYYTPSSWYKLCTHLFFMVQTMRPSIRPGTSWTEARCAVARPRAGVPALALAPAERVLHYYRGLGCGLNGAVHVVV
jgi:hypothetical protein